MFETECPRCRHVFPVAEADRAATCPQCGLRLDLVTEDAATGGPGEELLEFEAVAESPFTESPCPACGEPLLVAPQDEAGLCAHCDARLEFRDGHAFLMMDIVPRDEGRSYAPLVVCGRPAGRTSEGASESGEGSL